MCLQGKQQIVTDKLKMLLFCKFNKISLTHKATWTDSLAYRLDICLTIVNYTKLPADNIGIILIKCVFTDGAPGIVDADLHSALQWIVTSHQPQCTISTITSRGGGV